MPEIIIREHPILGISCPVCGCVFAVRALDPKYFNENEHEDNARQVKELVDYAREGMNIAFYYNKDGYKFKYCDHVKNRDRLCQEK